MNRPVVVDYLAHHPHCIPEIADLLFAQWSALFLADGVDKEQLLTMLALRATTGQLPITLVALSNGELLGTGSIKLAEPATRAGLSPWLAGMYIKAPYRGSGIGAQIVNALEAKARHLGVETLYLSVGAAVDFYTRLGWQVMEEHINSGGVRQVTLMRKRLLSTA